MMCDPETAGRQWSILAAILLSLFTVGQFLARPTESSYAAPIFQLTPTPTATPDPVAVFEDATSAAGVTFSGAQFGASWGDYDNDGWVDLFANNHFQNDPNLYHNNSNGTFTDLYSSSGMNNLRGLDPHGSRWGDYDNDGDLDLYVTTGQQRINPFYVNLGNSAFVERSVEAGVEDLVGRGRTANWIDYDLDGDLDLFKGNEVLVDGPDKLFRNDGDGTFSDVSDIAGLNDTTGTWGNVWADYDKDGDLDVVLTGGASVRLYRYDGDGMFTNMTTGVGIYPFIDRSWGADFGDYDNDGDLDLFIARGDYSTFDHVDVADSAITYILSSSNGEDGFDFRSSGSEVVFDTLDVDGSLMSARQVYIGAGGWHPAAIPFQLGAATNHHGAPAYIPGSDVGVFIWQDAPGETWHLRISNKLEIQGQVRTNGFFSHVVNVGLEPYHPSEKANRLYRNRGNGTFEEVGSFAGVSSTRHSRTGAWGDYNNDGLLDLYVVNAGNVEIGNEPNSLYRNNGDGTFSDVAEEAGVRAITPGFGDCGTWADYDHNGFLDLFVVTDGRAGYYGGPHKLYRNLGNDNHWLEINLIGTFSNRHGVGTRIDLLAGGMTQTRQMNNGSHYLCQNSPVPHFGLGSATHVEAITVTWPSGVRQAFRDVVGDQILTITESESLTITQSVFQVPVQAGCYLTYTLTISNQPTAADPAAGVVVTDMLPEYATLVDAGFVSPAGGVVCTDQVEATGAVTWTLSSPVAVAGQAQLYLTVFTSAPNMVISNTCRMTSDALLGPVWSTLVTTVHSVEPEMRSVYLPIILRDRP
jgi:uncharacterized repeat protein (TIGR01451 family)